MKNNFVDILKEQTNARIIWLLRESEQKYSDILKHLDERDSGKLNYHLKKLIAHNIICSKNGNYSLTAKGEEYSLYVDSLQLKEKYPLPVVLVAIMKDNKLLLAKRARVPCKNQWGLPGNELIYGQSPLEAAKEEIKTELDYETTFEKLYGVYPTKYSEKGNLIYHVILLLVKARVKKISDFGKAKGKISEFKFFAKQELEEIKIIPSNMQPILDIFAKTKRITIQDIN